MKKKRSNCFHNLTGERSNVILTKLYKISILLRMREQVKATIFTSK